MNIQAVMLGCGCEEGPACTEQVTVVGYRPERTATIELSKIDGKWSIGRLQRWRLREEELLAKQRGGDPHRFGREYMRLMADKPVCPEFQEIHDKAFRHLLLEPK